MDPPLRESDHDQNKAQIHASTYYRYLFSRAGDVGIEPTTSVLETEVIPFN